MPVSPPPSPPSAPPERSPPLHALLDSAAQALAGVLAGRSLNDELAAVPSALRPGTQALAFHALRHLGRAQAIRALLVKRQPPAWVDGLLLLALAMLLPDPSTTEPDIEASAHNSPSYAPHTLVDQAVRAAKQRATAQASMVNAVLRRALRESASLLQAVAQDPVARWNHPRWWIARLQRDWPQDWQRLLEAANRKAPMTLRVNARWGTAQAYLRLLSEAGIPAQRIGSHAIVLTQAQPVQRLPLFASGAVSVQDAAAQLAAPLLLGLGSTDSPPLPSGARVLDACAAPGGKTAQLLEWADLDLTAIDVDAQRATRITENLQRLRLPARVQAADAARPDSWGGEDWAIQPWDAILLDAPCSASGIVRRHPDVRWLRRESDIATLAAIQDTLLDSLWPRLREGGRLLFCTCSLFREEGQARADAFLQRTPDAERRFAPGHLPGVADNSGLQSLLGPADDQPALTAGEFDGFFYAMFSKRRSPP